MSELSTSATSTRRAVVADAFRSQLWPVPTLAVVVAVLLGVLVPELDARVDTGLSGRTAALLFGGGAEAARTVLGAVASSLVTLTSLTFSLTVVTLQLASGQFSPRLLRTFSSDRFVHVTLGLFLATFVYSLTVLRTVRTGSDAQAEVVPRISVTLSYVLAVASALALVLFLAHLAREIRVETMLRRVHAEAGATAERTLSERSGPVAPEGLPTPPSTAVPLLAPRSGFLTSLDAPALLAAAVDAGAVVLLERPPGSSLVAGTPVGWAWSLAGPDLPAGQLEALQERLAAALTTGHEPTGAQDVTFGLKQITDVACKALSPGVNDPRTAVHALGHSAALLSTLSTYALGPQVGRDEQGRPRLHWDRPALADLLDLAVSGPRRYGSSDPDVLARLYALLAEVAWSSDDPVHRRAVLHQLERLDATAAAAEADEDERARHADLAEQVRSAARGRHRSPARAVVS